MDNDVTAYINATGTYRLHLWDNVERLDPGDNVAGVMWDNAYLTVSTYSDSVGESSIDEVGDTGEVLLSLLPLFVLIGIILTLVFVFRR